MHCLGMKRFLIRVGAFLTCIFELLNPAESWGGTMNAERFFTGRHLTAYTLAQKGDVKGLLEVKKTGVDLNQPGNEDLTLLGLAVLNAEPRAIISLIRAGADPDQVIPGAGSPAVMAITKHFNPPRTEAVAALFDAGYDPNQLLDHGKPYMFFFIEYNHWPGLKLALERGGSVNVKRGNGKSLLMYIIEHGNYDRARELILMGADVAARTEMNETALEIIEHKIHNVKEVKPQMRTGWKKVLELRDLILDKLSDPKDRSSVFTEAAEARINENSIKVH